MATLNDIKRRVRSLEGNVRKQLKVLQKGAEQGMPRIPIGPGPVLRLRRAVAKVRRELNARLMQLDRSLAKVQAGQRKKG